MNELLLRQLVHADKVLINKVDLLKEAEKETKINSLHDCIQHVNKHALVKETTYAQADLDFLIEKPLEKAIEKSTQANESGAKHGHNHDLSHQIMQQINSVYLTLDSPLIKKDKLEFLIGELLWEGEENYGVHVMRCKGIFMDGSGETP